MKLWLLAGSLLAALLLIELILRFGFGFGRPPLYVADETMGYRLAPNQRIRRLGNRIRINEYSMRADAIAPQPASDTFRLFLIGDSLANGNWWTDQDNILSVLIANALRPNLPEGYSQIEALNASANSWGPRNQLAYLERYGTFGSSTVVLLLNTDDLFGSQPTALQVGRDRNYPSRNYPLATAEVLSRLLKKNQPIPGLKAVQAEKGDRIGKNLTAINSIYQKVGKRDAEKTHIPFLLVLSPLKRELPGPRDYELVARKRLQDWATDNDVAYLDLLSAFQQHPSADTLYRDHIHLSPDGNQLVSSSIAKAIIQSN